MRGALRENVRGQRRQVGVGAGRNLCGQQVAGARKYIADLARGQGYIIPQIDVVVHGGANFLTNVAQQRARTDWRCGKGVRRTFRGRWEQRGGRPIAECGGVIRRLRGAVHDCDRVRFHVTVRSVVGDGIKIARLGAVKFHIIGLRQGA